MQKPQLSHFLFFKQFLKIIFYLTSGVYMLTLPAFGYYMAYPLGLADPLFPYEVVLTLILSGVLFALCAKSIEETLKNAK